MDGCFFSSQKINNQTFGQQNTKISFFTAYERDLKRTVPEILVDMASWFGVFLGVSILSLVEIIYWFIGNPSQK